MSAEGGGTGRIAASRAPAGEGLAARIPGLLVALAGAGLLGWSVWSGSRPVEGLQRGGAEWLVPESRMSAAAGEARAPEPAAGPAAPGPPASAGDADAGVVRPARENEPALLIDVNIATAAQLDLLPEIGPVMAQRIVDDRASNGPFLAPEDLMRVRGIGEKTVEKIRGLIVCGGQ